jgi:hypothetical protein
MTIKTFKGKISSYVAASATETGKMRIRLSTNDGKTGYKIKKFQAIGTDVTGRNQESVLKLFSVDPGTPSGAIDLDSPTLLAVCFYEQSSSSSYFGDQVIIVDSKKINQDIWLTHDEASDDHDVNFYIELETFRLNENEATVATLKDMRGSE